MANDNCIATQECDMCCERKPGVLFHHLGSPVMFECRDCNPKAFETQSRHDIDRWLEGSGG